MVDNKYHIVVLCIVRMRGRKPVPSYFQPKVPGGPMDKEEFSEVRKKINKTQKQMAELLGTSVKAIHSYEQGWRSIPPHVERQLFFLISRLRNTHSVHKPCWIVKRCPPSRKKKCPAWEFKAGKLCWFINGTICEGKVRRNWQEKMKICRTCEVLVSLI
jgi:DNA-binding XRE family transcriptional regulator